MKTRSRIIFGFMALSYYSSIIILLYPAVTSYTSFLNIHPLAIFILCICVFFYVMLLASADLGKYLRIWHWIAISGLFIGLFKRSSLGFFSSSSFWAQYHLEVINTVVFTWGSMFLMRRKAKSMSNRIHVVPWITMFTGTWIYVTIIAFVIGISTISWYSSLPFSCEDLDNWTEQVIWTLLTPLQLWSETVKNTSVNIKEFLSQNDPNSDTIPSETMEVITETTYGPSIILFLQETIISIRSGTNDTKSSTCEILYNKIQTSWETPWIKYSSLFLMIFLLWPFLSVLFNIVNVLAYLTFIVLCRFGVWKREISSKDVEDII